MEKIIISVDSYHYKVNIFFRIHMHRSTIGSINEKKKIALNFMKKTIVLATLMINFVKTYLFYIIKSVILSFLHIQRNK